MPRNTPDRFARAAGAAREATPGASAPALVADAFVLRTPLLPFAELDPEHGDAPGEPLSYPQRVERARVWLRGLADRPVVREALSLGSPSLADSLSAWQREPESERGQRVERALVRYISRLAARPTPFGLFAGVSVGQLAGSTRLELEGLARYELRSRLDIDYLTALVQECEADPSLRRAARYRPNSSLYEVAGGILRYVGWQQVGRRRMYTLAQVEASEFVLLALATARDGAAFAHISAALCTADPEIEAADADAFVDELVASRILVGELEPPLTGGDPAEAVAATLCVSAAGAARGAALEAAREALAEHDKGGLGRAPERYREVAETLPALASHVDSSRLFAVGLHKPGRELTLGPETTAELERGLRLLHRITPYEEPQPLRQFREAFMARYEGAEVRLVEALDSEAGVGFGAEASPTSEASPLLAGLPFPAPGRQGPPWGPREAYLYERVRALGDGARVLTLSGEDLRRLEVERRLPLPPALLVAGCVAARSPEALAEGRCEVLVLGGAGPSGARMLGRFCHLTPELDEAVRRHLRAEEQSRPEAVFAEIVHLQDGGIGSVLHRPVLREHEIVYVGRSGAPVERQIPVDDLWVRVAGGRIELRSRRLQREVVPRLTNAHDFAGSSLPVYRFLCSLQYQGFASALEWRWGALAQLPGFLPRVCAGRIVLARARWTLVKGALATLQADSPEERYHSMQALRSREGLPRWVVVVDYDNRLVLDLDNPLCVESLAHLCRKADRIVLEENYPGPDELCASGPEGRFVHELLVTFTAPGSAGGAGSTPASESAAASSGVAVNEDAQPRVHGAPPRRPRRFAPGSEWLFVKVYTGSAAADRVLTDIVRPFVERQAAAGGFNRWFFVRYADPDPHLRLRFRGEPGQLLRQVWEPLAAELRPLVDDGRVHRLALDTYVPEAERYGGEAALDVMEGIFRADSDAALAVVAETLGESGAARRWPLVLCGLDALLGDLGLDLEARRGLAARLREAYGREHHANVPLDRQLGEKYRAERAIIEAVLTGSGAPEYAPGLAALAERSQRLAPLVAELDRLAAGGALSVSRADLAASVLHMSANRLLRGAARAHELVLYDFLARRYQSLVARRRPSAS